MVFPLLLFHRLKGRSQETRGVMCRNSFRRERLREKNNSTESTQANKAMAVAGYQL